MSLRPVHSTLLSLLVLGALGVGCSREPTGPTTPSPRETFDAETFGPAGPALPSPAPASSAARRDGPIAGGRTWYVAVDGSGDVPTIQDAIDAVSAGDEIVVGPGRYTWSNQGSGTDYGFLVIRAHQQDFVLRSEAGPEQTILDPEGRGRGMNVIAYNDGVVIEGFTFTNGDAFASAYGYETGGGLLIHVTSPTIRRCILRGNEARTGGGFATAGSCGALVEDCVIEDNIALARGGGIFLHNSVPTMTFLRCRIAENFSGETGGGFACINAPFVLEDCEIVGNVAEQTGAALSVYRLPHGTVRRSTLFRNYAPDEGQLRTVLYSNLRLERSIVAEGGGAGALWVEEGSSIEVECSDLFGNQGGDAIGPDGTDLGANFHLDPRFWDGDGGDLRLHPLSPCASGHHPDGGDCGRVGARDPIDFRTEVLPLR